MINLFFKFIKSYVFIFDFSQQSKQILYSIFFFSLCIGGFDFLFLYLVSKNENIILFDRIGSEFIFIIPAILFIARNILYLFCSYLQGLWLSKIRSTLSTRIMEEYLHSGLDYLYQIPNGEINRNLTSETLIATASMASIIAVTVEILILSCWVMLIPYEDIPLLIGLLGFVTLVIYGFFFVKFFSNVRLNRSKFEAERSELAMEVIENKELFWSLGTGSSSAFLKKFESSCHNTAYNDNLRSWLSGAQRPFFEIVGACGFLGYFFMVEASRLEVGTDPAIFAVLGGFFFVRVLPSILKITTSIQSLFISCDAVFRIQDLVDTLRANDRNDVPQDKISLIMNFKGSSSSERFLVIESCAVCFDDETEAVDMRRTSRGTVISRCHLNSNILHLEGRSGVGKSSLIKSLLGNCTINGLNAAFIPGFDQKLIGYASQDARLVGGSVTENILLGRVNQDDSWLHDLIRGLQIDQFAVHLEQGINTPLKRTHSLSGGQVQRIALARAIFGKPSVLLLDEALSGVEIALQSKILEFVFSLDWRPITLFTSHHADTLPLGLKFQKARLINVE